MLAPSSICTLSVQQVKKDSKPLHVLPSCIAEHLWVFGCFISSPRGLHQSHTEVERGWPVRHRAHKRSGVHLFKPDNENTVVHAGADEIPRHIDPRGPSCTRIVDVVYGDLSHSKLVERALATAGRAERITCYTGFDIVVGYVRVEHGFDTRFKSQLGIHACGPGL